MPNEAIAIREFGVDETTHQSRSGAVGTWSSSEAPLRAVMWASLVPLTLLLHPYAGLAQDARIYLGRGVADRDLAGVGRDTVFVHDGQTGFSVMARVVDAMLGVMTPDAASMLISAVGLMVWLAAAVCLALKLERGCVAWAIVVGLLALPGAYGGFNTFAYAEAVATPRVFAEAAVLGGFAALLAGRSWLGLALVVAAAAVHPLMALPGLAVAALMLVRADRRWLVPIAVAGGAVIVGALLGVPLLGRLFVPFDPAWAAILRQRSVNLFPSLWSSGVYLVVAQRLVAALIAASLLAGAPRALMVSCVAVALAGLGAAALLGDAWMLELVTQLQPWRALWLLAAMGNAGFVISAVRLWRGSDCDRLVLGALATAWLLDQGPVLQIGALAGAAGLRAASMRGFEPSLSRHVLRTLALLVACLALYGIAQGCMVTVMLLRAAWSQGGEVAWHFAIDTDVAALSVMVVALSGIAWASPRDPACLPCQEKQTFVGQPTNVCLGLVHLPGPRLRAFWARRFRAITWISAAAFVGACGLAALAWDETPAERGAARYPEATAALRRAIGPSPGEVMWIDEDDETWFLAGRPAFFDVVQGAPILFSRALALDWADRASAARALGWAREIDIAPWTAPPRRLDPIVLRPAAVEDFCRNPRRPSAVVAPGEQAGAAPPGWTATLWRPAKPFHRMWIDGETIRWTTWDVFTVIRCPVDTARRAPPPNGDGDRDATR